MAEDAKNRNYRSHYKVINGQLVPKKTYKTEKEALRAAQCINSKPHTIHRMVAYKCSKCDGWHIGNNGHVLTDEDKEHFAEMAKNNRKFERMTYRFFHKKKT